MSNRNFTIDFTAKQIIGTKTSLKKARCYGSAEYKELCKLVEAHPRFRVVKRKIEKNNSKQTYKKLNFKFIENYISIQSNKDELLREYNEIKKFAVSVGMSVYPYTKSWFLKKFGTEDKPFNMDEAREEIKSAGFAAAQVKSADQATEPAATQGKTAIDQVQESATDQDEAAA